MTGHRYRLNELVIVGRAFEEHTQASGNEEAAGQLILIPDVMRIVGSVGV